jgi:L-threonylcarbamoyladenylate synthase
MGSVDQAVAAIESGQPVVLPTDTVYGLCARADDEEAVARVQRLKQRPGGMALALLCSDLAELFDRVPELRNAVEVLLRALLPGPYTLVLPNPQQRFAWLSPSSPDTIGVRVPALTGDAKRVLARIGAVVATSANRHGGPDPRRLEEVPAEIREACGAVLDGGELPGIPSTVLDLTGDEPRVLREGAVPAAEARALVASVVG